MVEENKKISDEDMKAIEAEVAKKQAEALKTASESTAKEVEAKVRKEMEDKLAAEKLQEQLKKQTEELEKTRADTEAKLKAQQEAFEKRLQELEAQRKGIVDNKSPFEKNPNLKVVDGKEIDTTSLDLNEIERQSAEAFRRYHNLPSWYFEKTGQTKR